MTRRPTAASCTGLPSRMLSIRSSRRAGGASPRRRLSEPLDGLPGVLDRGRRLERMPDELAPFLEIRRFAEIHGVVLQRLPFDEEAEPARLLDRALQLHALASLGPLEDRRGLADTGFELRLEARL